jgi:transposase
MQPPAPNNPGWVRGYAVVRERPWHLRGIYPTRNEAERALKEAGDGYRVAFGDHRPGSDDFIFNDPAGSIV